MKILLLHNGWQDYLLLGLMHGFRQLKECTLVDVPKYTFAYQAIFDSGENLARGNGFSLYGLLPQDDIREQERAHWQEQIKTFDVILVAYLFDTWEKAKWIGGNKRKDARLFILDSTYPPQCFPWEAMGDHLRARPRVFSKTFSDVVWYKREWEPGKTFGNLYRLLPNGLLHKWEQRYTFRPVSFGFPEEKITLVDPAKKTQMFSTQVIDQEVAANMPGALFNPLRGNQYVFETEQAYYADLQRSKFGITGKRAGWECLRHYEMAANGTVLCFKDLDKKPATCAPYGLDESNSINYHHYDDLMEKINKIDASTYCQLQQGGYKWVRNYSTRAVAARLLEDFRFDLNN